MKVFSDVEHPKRTVYESFIYDMIKKAKHILLVDSKHKELIYYRPE